MNRLERRKVKSSSSVKVIERNAQYSSLRPPISATLAAEALESRRDEEDVVEPIIET